MSVDSVSLNRYRVPQINCKACDKDILGQVHINCAYCTDTLHKFVNLCIDCFQKGAEYDKAHKRWHSYRVIDNLSYSLFDQDWSAEQELLLLDAIKYVGDLEWDRIAKNMNRGLGIEKKKTKQEIRLHYYNIYFNTPTAPLPDTTKRNEVHEYFKYITGTSNSKQAVGIRLNRIKLLKYSDTPNSTCLMEAAGYLPFRDVFENEYENFSEVEIKDILIQEDDMDWFVKLKLARLRSYNDVLLERNRLKAFTHDYGLFDVDYVKKMSDGSEYTQEEFEIRKLLDPYMVTMKCKTYRKLLREMLKQNELKRRIEQLEKLKARGVQSVSTNESSPKRVKCNSYTELSAEETQLCTLVGLESDEYCFIKGVLIDEYVKTNEPIALKKLVELFTLNFHKTLQVYSFCLSNAWIE